MFFNIFAQNIDCGYTLEPPQRADSNKYTQSVLDKKDYPCTVCPQFYYIKAGSKGVYISRTCYLK